MHKIEKGKYTESLCETVRILFDGGCCDPSYVDIAEVHFSEEKPLGREIYERG